jgi:maltose O-acetyltransferase
MASMIDYFAGDSRTNRERMLAGDLYIADDPESGRRAQRAVQLADAYHQAAVAEEGAARPILAELLGNLGEGAFVKPPLYVDYGEHISIGAALSSTTTSPLSTSPPSPSAPIASSDRTCNF